MSRTKADLPFTLDMLGYRVRFRLDSDGDHVLATCDQWSDLRVRSLVTEHAVTDASLEVMKLAAGEVDLRR